MRRRSFLNATAAGLASTLALGRPGAAQFIPKASERKWAVLFGTWYGTARDAAVWISEGMGGIEFVPFEIRRHLRKYRTVNTSGCLLPAFCFSLGVRFNKRGWYILLRAMLVSSPVYM